MFINLKFLIADLLSWYWI